MRIRFYDTSAGVLVWVICGRIYVFFRGKQIKLGASPPSLSLSLALFSPSNFRSDSAMKHKKFPGEMRTGKQRQREETAAETGETGVGRGERVLVS